MKNPATHFGVQLGLVQNFAVHASYWSILNGSPREFHKIENSSFPSFPYSRRLGKNSTFKTKHNLNDDECFGLEL